MTRRWTDVLWLGVIGLLSVLVFVWAHPNDRDSSMLNKGWNGLSQASDALLASPLLSYSELTDVVQPATLIVMPRLWLEPSALAALDRFIDDGGTLIVLDDFGHGNDLLAELGVVGVRLSGAPLLDPLYCYRDASLPRVEVVGGAQDEAPISPVLNDATWLEVDSPDEVWAQSSYFSYGDGNRDGARSSGDLDGPLPVGAVVPRGAGYVVVVSDSSLLLNSMVEVGDNVEALASFVKGEVIIDQVHLPEARVDRSKVGFEAIRDTLGSGAGVVVLVLLSCGLAVGYAWYNRGRHENE
jgi:hypothetical protein